MLAAFHSNSLGGCNLAKGARFVEPMCHSDGTPLHDASSKIVSSARDDALYNQMTGNAVFIPEEYRKESASSSLYRTVFVAALDEGKFPYARR